MYDNMLDDGIKEYSHINESKSSNLENGLLERKCVDAGYAEILKNCLAVLGISSKIVRGNFAGIGEEHIWNQVKIDDVWYNVDLSLDSKRMSGTKKTNNKPTYCLISDRVFSKTHIPKIAKTEYCPNSFNQKIISNFFKKESVIKLYIQTIINKVKKIFSYNKQLLLEDSKADNINDFIKKENDEN